jgi:anti-sigma factor RsiW
MNPLACASGVDLLMDYLEGALPDEVRTAIEEHVSGCTKCQAFIAGYQRTPSIMRNATAASIPQELQASLVAFLRSRRLVPPAD